MKCPKCLVGELFLTDSGGEPEYQEAQWVRCDNDEVPFMDADGELSHTDCDFTDDNDDVKYETIQSWYGFDEEEATKMFNEMAIQ